MVFDAEKKWKGDHKRFRGQVERNREKILQKNWNRISKLSKLIEKTEKEKLELECRIKLHNGYGNGKEEEALKVMRKINDDVGVYDE